MNGPCCAAMLPLSSPPACFAQRLAGIYPDCLGTRLGSSRPSLQQPLAAMVLASLKQRWQKEAVKKADLVSTVPGSGAPGWVPAAERRLAATRTSQSHVACSSGGAVIAACSSRR